MVCELSKSVMNTHYGMLRLDTSSSYFSSQPWILLESSPHQGTAIPTTLVYINVFNMCLISLGIISCTALCPIRHHAMTSLTITLWSALKNATASCLLHSKLAVLGKPVCGRSEMSVLSSLVFLPMSHTKSNNNFCS